MSEYLKCCKMAECIFLKNNVDALIDLVTDEYGLCLSQLSNSELVECNQRLGHVVVLLKKAQKNYECYTSCDKCEKGEL